jgi:hypothetical protein
VRVSVLRYEKDPFVVEMPEEKSGTRQHEMFLLFVNVSRV